MTYRLCLIHAFDPRGTKVGGIETHLRLVLAKHPADFEVVVIGYDGRCELPIGEPHHMDFEGRPITFIPVLHDDEERVREAAKTLTQSLTLRFSAGILRHFASLRRYLRAKPTVVELERYEYAPIVRAMGLRYLQIVHLEPNAKDKHKMDSLLKSYWYIHRTAEVSGLRMADKILAVNPDILARIKQEAPKIAQKADFMTVSVNTDIFQPAPYQIDDHVLRIAFAGRLDTFKDPSLMFTVIDRLAGALHGQVEFHFIGTSDPHKFPEFAKIEARTVRHGFQPMRGVAEILTRCHAGIFTSYFEGMPCFMLETLASGRPVGAIRLPQFDPILLDRQAGFLVERRDSLEASADAMAEKFLELWADIRSGHYQPADVATHVGPYTVETQLPRLFALHRAIIDRQHRRKAASMTTRAAL